MALTTPSSVNSTSDTLKNEVQTSPSKLINKTCADTATLTIPSKSEPPTGEFALKLQPVVSSTSSVESSTGHSLRTLPGFANIGSTASTVAINSQPEQLSIASVPFPASLSTFEGTISEKNEDSDVVVTQEDDMEEEAPETSQTAELSLGSLGGFRIGGTPNPSLPKPSPFGGPFGNTAASSTSTFTMNVPSGELFRPASFNFQSPQSSQPTQPGNFGQFSGGFGAGTAVQAPTQTGFGQQSQIGAGQQALGSVLGAFGQSRQLGAGLPGAGLSTTSSFGGGFAGTNSLGGFPSAATGGGFAGLASGGGGFAGMASSGGGFAGVASGGGGFAGVASSGGFGGMGSAGGGFSGVASGGGFGGMASAAGGFAAAASAGGGFAGAAAPGSI